MFKESTFAKECSKVTNQSIVGWGHHLGNLLALILFAYRSCVLVLEPATKKAAPMEFLYIFLRYLMFSGFKPYCSSDISHAIQISHMWHSMSYVAITSQLNIFFFLYLRSDHSLSTQHTNWKILIFHTWLFCPSLHILITSHHKYISTHLFTVVDSANLTQRTLCAIIQCKARRAQLPTISLHFVTHTQVYDILTLRCMFQ